MEDQRIVLDAQERAELFRLGRWGFFCGIVSIVISLLDFEVAFLTKGFQVTSVIGLGVGLILNIWIVKASLAIKQAAQSAAVSELQLMQGFIYLRRYFAFNGILLYVLVGLVVLGVLILLGRAYC